MADALSARVAAVRGRIAAACRRAGRAPEAVGLVAVAKRVPAERVRAAVADGVRMIGESYVQEWREKRTALADLAIDWHFVGRLQRNKARAAAECALVHSLADRRVAEALARVGREHARPVHALLQVRLGGEDTKDGVEPADVPAALATLRALPGLAIDGLMTVPPPLAPEAVRALFRELRELRDRQPAAEALPQLSMGMSADFEVAIEEGATLVRIGTALFGPRTKEEAEP